ncbi:MAG: Fe-S cluster assembly protein SufD [Dehalococcoidia bacterium]
MTHASGPARTAALQIAAFSRQGVEMLSHTRGEPDWLREARLAAWAAFEAMPWPTGKEEEWRRIDIRTVSLEDVTPATDATERAVLPEHITALADDDAEAGLLVVHHGAAVSYTARLPEGVIFSPLDEAIRSYPDLVRRYLGTAVRPDDGPFAALNAAFWTGGTLLYVPAGVSVDLPVRTLHWADGQGVGLFDRTLVILDRGASATMIDDYLSTAEATGLDASAVELVVAGDAQLRSITLQDWGPGIASLATLRGLAGRDAAINWLIVALGARLARTDLAAVMAEPGSHHELLGLCFGTGAQQFDLHTLQQHAAPHTTSDLLFKGVLKDSARSAFAGLIQVAKGAQRTDAYLANRNLLLSDKARADSIPTLEIEANDVRCTHGATVGPIDESQVFYLMARGIPRPEAERMIVEGFLEPLLSRVPIEGVRARLDRSVALKMAGV